jgi:phosphoglycerol transferase MdoB-like AlkP superfamily enzyme
MSGYFLLLPIIFNIIFYVSGYRKLLKLIDWVNYLFILFYTLTLVGESCLYREWKSKLSMQALQHFMHPSEVFRTTSWGLTVLFFSLSIILMVFFVWLYNKKVAFKKMEITGVNDVSKIKKYALAVIAFLVLSTYSVLSIRGGVQAIPIQNSDAYFSNFPVVNDAAVNPFWNILYSISDYMLFSKENPYTYFSQAEADKITHELFYIEKDTTVQFLEKTRPNIVFIILESWSADCIKSFGGDDFAPFMDSLSKQSIYFTNMYSAGYVSDQGIPAVLSAYPTTSRVSIVNQSSKSMKIPCVNQDLKKYGYQSGFVFGGDLNYGNIKSYLFNKEFDVIKEEKDIDGSFARGKLGVQDRDMSDVYIQTLNQAQAPFVYAWFTISTHMPYDFSKEKKQLVNHKENDFINSVVYADNALRHFFNEAKKQTWYSNTLFVLVSDHSHDTHKEYNVYNPAFHRIPCLFFGDVIKADYRGMEVKNVFSQVDILPTLLNQMQLNAESKQYVFAKNMFNPYVKNFAYNSSFSGAAFVINSGYIGYQHGLKDFVVNTFTDAPAQADSINRLSKAVEQVIFEDYRLK